MVMDFDRWFASQGKVSTPSSSAKKVRQLTEDAQLDRDSFEAREEGYGRYSDRGCSCFISPPCGWCTHPGNPCNQEDDECWELVAEDEVIRDTE